MRDLKVRFWEKVRKLSADECWEWTGAVHSTARYGVIGLGSRDMGLGRAHRLSYCWANSLELPDIAGRVVMHSCDNPACVNPAHLSLGTDADNMRDKCRKGRGFVARGSSNKSAKLTESQVLEIRAIHDSSTRGFGCKSLAKRFGVTEKVVRRIIRREKWAHI